MSLLDKATIITTPTAHSNGTLHSIKGGAVADFDVVRGSAATRVNAEGIIESVATDTPRIDYTTGEGVVLLEPQSTNLVPNSEDFSNASWTKTNCTISANQATSPDGTLNADLMTATSNDARLEDTVASSGIIATQSIYVKSANGGDVDGQIDFAGADTVLFTATNEWQRVETTLTVTAIAPRLRIRITNNGDSLYVWGAQVEALSYATSYIPTSGAIATRLADSVSGAGDATTFNSTEGVLYAEISTLNGDSGSNRTISLSDSTNGNQIRFYFPINIESQIIIRVDVGGSTIYVFAYNIITSETPIKLAFRYSPNGMDFYVNGSLVSSSALVPSFTNNLNSLQFRRGDGQFGADFFGKVKSLITYNTALTDAELECLTTI